MSKQKTEFKMEQIFAMWLQKSKNGGKFLTGKDSTGKKLVGFFNGKKQNPKEPDVRIYEVDQDGKASKDEYISLWCNLSKNDKKYLSGKLGEKRVVGFINPGTDPGGKRPYFSVYESDSEPPKKEEKNLEPSKEPLPFD